MLKFRITYPNGETDDCFTRLDAVRCVRNMMRHWKEKASDYTLWSEYDEHNQATLVTLCRIDGTRTRVAITIKRVEV